MVDEKDLEKAFEQRTPEPLELPEIPEITPLPPEPVELEAPLIPVEVVPEAKIEEEPKDELSDLFEVPQPTDNDMETKDLFGVPEEGDLGDLVEVSEEDIMGEPELEPEPPPKPRFRLVRRIKRTPKYYPPPPTGIRGIRG